MILNGVSLIYYEYMTLFSPLLSLFIPRNRPA
jgi:hypothetical protein